MKLPAAAWLLAMALNGGEALQFRTVEKAIIEQRLEAAAKNNSGRLSGREILVGAHFDHVPAGDGVIDNWSGAALLPSLYQSLEQTPRHHTFRFIGFTDEEKGLVGSRDYAEHLDEEGRRRISAMINIDSVGIGPTKLDLDHASQQLVDAIAASGRRKLAQRWPLRRRLFFGSEGSCAFDSLDHQGHVSAPSQSPGPACRHPPGRLFRYLPFDRRFSGLFGSNTELRPMADVLVPSWNTWYLPASTAPP